MSDRPIKLELSQDEALVLFDWLARFNQEDRPDLFEAQAERLVLWNLEALLEGTLAAPLGADYKTLVSEARARLQTSNE